MICFESEEIWLPLNVEGFSDRYSISSKGRIYSNYGKGRIMKPKKDKDGYHTYCLSFPSGKKHLRVHRLVALTFIPKPIYKDIVNHLDGDINNNSITNLEWTTEYGNSVHGVRLYKNNTISSLGNEIIQNVVSLYKKGYNLHDIKVKLNIDLKTEYLTEILKGRKHSNVTGIKESIVRFRNENKSFISSDTVFSLLEDHYTNNMSINEVTSKYEMKYHTVYNILKGNKRKELYDTFFERVNE